MVKLNNLNKGRLCLMLICIILAACSNTKKDNRSIRTIHEPPLYGKWQMTDWNGEGKPDLDISLDFNRDGEYTDSRSDDAIWNYSYIEPDTLILYHHGIYEERYKILSISNDSLIVQLHKSLIHTEENEKEIVTEYGNCEPQTFRFIHK